MAYQQLPEVNEKTYSEAPGKEFIEDIISRKEFARLIRQPEITPAEFDPNEALPFQSKHLRLQAQQLFCQGFINPNTQYKSIWLKHGTGIGKCFAAGTQIRMYNGTSKVVEEIVSGDLLMGDDFKPREVLSTVSGQEEMFKCVLEGGGEFTCNLSHILCLHDGIRATTMTIQEYLALPMEEKTIYHMYKKVRNAGQGTARVHHWIKMGALQAKMHISGNYLKIHSGSEKYLCMLAQLCWAAGIKVHLFQNARLGFNTGVIWIDKDFRAKEYQYYSFEVVPCPNLTEYYGFSISGNRQFLLADFTVAHNTLASVVIAEQFVNVYKKMYTAQLSELGFGKGGQMHGRRAILESDRATPTVFVFGFTGTKIAFLNELMKWPDFGYVSAAEREKLTDLHSKNQEAYLEYYSFLKKRITSKINGGFYKFYGYDEFVNRFFVSETINLAELEQKALKSDEEGQNIEDMIRAEIEKGTIQINRALLSQMENCIIICDEAHNLYNSVMKNSRGVAIQYILDTIPSIRAVFVSATPINTPGEIVDMVNLLCPKDKKIAKSDVFARKRSEIEENSGGVSLTPGALDLIGARLFGRISFVQDFNIKYYPAQIIEGEEFKLEPPIAGLSVIPYLKFIICEIPQLHAAAFAALAADQPGIVPPVIPSDGQALYDLVFPSPDGLPLYRRDIVRTTLTGPNSPEFTTYAALQQSGNKNYIITGQFLTKPEIAKYSGKYHRMLEALDGVFENGRASNRGEKIMIYHNRVKQNGVLLIQEILRQNGLIDDISEPVENTRCTVCGQPANKHSPDDAKSGKKAPKTAKVDEKPGEHRFIPARYIIIHNGVDRNTISNLTVRFNAPDNNYGEKIKILVGSKVMKESFDLKAVQHLWVMSLPNDIPTLLQIFGRARRNKSHIMLPPENRAVHIRIFISKSPASIAQFPEQYKYVDKLLNYAIVQKFENVMNKVAVDANLYRQRVMPPDLKAQLLDEQGRPKNMLGNTYFEPLFEPKMPDRATETTYEAYEYNTEEVRALITNIKLLFLQRAVWTYEELWAAIHRSRLMDVNSSSYDKGNFAVAMSFLVDRKTNIQTTQDTKDTDFNTLLERLFNPSEKYIYRPGQTENQNRYKIDQIGSFYILFPAARGSNIVGDRLITDVDVFLRQKDEIAREFITLNDITAEPFDYIENLRKFMQDMPKTNLALLITDSPKIFQKALIEDIILYSSGDKSYLGDEDKKMVKQIIDFYKQFSVFVYAQMLTPDVKDKFKGETGPIGYIDGRYVHLRGKSGWATLERVATIKVWPEFVENKEMVGYMEEGPDFVPIFKLRRSLASYDIKKGGPVDIRQIDRGIACHNKGKDQIVEMARTIGINTESKAFIKELAQMKIKNLCNVVRARMIENEANERARKSSKKWFYFWWEELPSIKSTFR